MLNNRKLIVDTFCEVHDLLYPLADGEFWDLSSHTIEPDAIYLIGREQFRQHKKYIKELAEANTILPILGNPAEGSETLFKQIQSLGILELVQQNKILVITGGYLPDSVPSLYYENFLPKILDYNENVDAATQYRDNWHYFRPYKFLFLNGRGRPHRKYFLNRLQPLLDQAIWTNLDSAAGTVKTLDPAYEFDFYKNNTQQENTGFVKHKLFNGDWGDIYLNSAPYLDTYFSFVTETVFDYPHSFRTEKIWKPIGIGHPFVVASNAGYYRDLHNLGFETFGHLIDESFDRIDDNQSRQDRIATVVEDLCAQNLSAFVSEAQEVCKYNQQLLAELRPKIRDEFPQRFINYINERS